ncbi:MAG: cell division protein SepF [Peptostreptococcaceae bacterium]|nr:cell division protein SepF [Peptostreptococcaceae bacterium]MDY5739212.1 cell division protein SepF [Anaerovoracaceae bacterium]SFE57165.1 cell division inhibitor SepF [Peptostreptococcaceae bacterium pGA-8]
MGFTEKIKQVIGIEDLEDDDIYEAEVEAAKNEIKENRRPTLSETLTTDGRHKSSEKRFSIANTSAFKLVLIEPKSFEECPKLVDSLKGRRPVIINLEKLENESARKIFDFLSGATYALNGNVQKVANNIFIFAPENVDITGDKEESPVFDLSNTESSPWK